MNLWWENSFMDGLVKKGMRSCILAYTAFKNLPSHRHTHTPPNQARGGSRLLPVTVCSCSLSCVCVCEQCVSPVSRSMTFPWLRPVRRWPGSEHRAGALIERWRCLAGPGRTLRAAPWRRPPPRQSRREVKRTGGPAASLESFSPRNLLFIRTSVP